MHGWKFLTSIPELNAWVEVFTVIPEFRILRLPFNGKSVS